MEWSDAHSVIRIPAPVAPPAGSARGGGRSADQGRILHCPEGPSPPRASADQRFVIMCDAALVQGWREAVSACPRRSVKGCHRGQQASDGDRGRRSSVVQRLSSAFREAGRERSSREEPACRSRRRVAAQRVDTTPHCARGDDREPVGRDDGASLSSVRDGGSRGQTTEAVLRPSRDHRAAPRSAAAAPPAHRWRST
jgi:hypothetical protein